MWNDLTMSERADVIKMAVKAGLRDMKSIRDFYDNSLKYADGGSKPGMTGMMKSKLAIASHFGNPTARRMTNYDTRNYTFPNRYDEKTGLQEIGNVYVSSYDNLVTPQIQDNGKELEFVPEEKIWDREHDPRSYAQSIKFYGPNADKDAQYFGEHYKEVAPMMNLYAEGGPKVTLVDSDKVRMSPSGTFSDDNGNIIGDSIVLPEVTVKPTTPQTNDSYYYQQWLMRQADRGGKNMSSSDREAYDRMMSRVANQNEVKNFTGFDGTVYNHGSGALEQVSPEFDALMLGRQLVTDGLLNVAGKKLNNIANRGKLLYNVDITPVNNNVLLNDALLNELTFVNGAIRNKSSLAAKTVEDVVSFTYGLPKGITPKTKLSDLTNEQLYELATRDIKRENPGNWFIGIGNSAKNNRYIHMDANSSIIPTTDGFLPTREGFTKVGRYGTPEIWYNKAIPYYPRELFGTPRTVVTTQEALGVDGIEQVAHTPKSLKYEDILFGVEPNEFGWYNKVKYTPYKRAPLSNTPYNPSINPNNLFNAKHKLNFAEGGSIHIAPSKRGTFTEAATKHGMGVQEFASKVLANKDNYSPAMVKKANFAKNASKWKHGLGGYLFI